MIKVAVNGYGTIGKRVADAVACQPDMEIVGVSKTSMNADAYVAKARGYPLYIADLSKRADFEDAGVPVAGSVAEMITKADVVVDATPGGVGLKNRPMYEQHGVRAIYQGGEKHATAGFSFNSSVNYDEARGRQFVRVVSCNTTGLVRIINEVDRAFGVGKVRAVMVRRGGDPGDVKRGPIDAIVLDPVTLPSHHGPDVQSVLPHIEITTAAMIVPTTFMHMHAVQMTLKRPATREQVIELFRAHSRIGLVKGPSGIRSSAELKEYMQDIGRPRSDMWENGVFEESVSVVDGTELWLFQAIHQEADVVVENVDAIRAIASDVPAAESIRMTEEALGFVALG
ncbi:MAG TPA: type II glyceraldehyde-3-phosphate dehydrogenase [Methanoregulaceae archaeon]|nr:type II glyceraldehyde-3-phosphate dehydrogenase [Methanoregulaceae archaeon]HQJ88631.1 type II glyceraldehyde-3-phosphate dehydrogenase [Methanoregulaceae archaeon]